MKSFAGLSLALAACALVGCKVGPNYKPPTPNVPASFSTTQPSPPVARWWDTFHDPQLSALVDRAAKSNLDLQLASSRLLEARAQRDVVNASFFPEVDSRTGYERAQISKKAGFLGFSSVGGSGASGSGASAGGSSGGTGSSGNGTLSSPSQRTQAVRARPAATAGGSSASGLSALGIPSRLDLWQAGFDARWEIDVFGGVQRSVEAATADIQARQEARRDTLVTLLGEVARNYMQIRGMQREIRIAEENIVSQQQTVDLTRSRFKAGLANDLDVARAEAQVATTSATVPTFRTQLKQSIHRVSVLLGEPPESLTEEFSKEAPIPPPPGAVPVGLPSDLLRRRPDVRRAERQMAAASARVGVATADLFPRFSLTGGLGLESQKFKDIARSDSIFWNIGPSISWPIFDAGRIRANVRVENEREKQAVVQYKQAVLTSLEDVENALAAYEQEQHRRVSLQQAVEANRRAVDLANQLYSKGLVDFLNVLESQRNLFAAQDQLVQSEQTVSANLVALYKALGGGWEEMELPEPEPQPAGMNIPLGP